MTVETHVVTAMSPSLEDGLTLVFTPKRTIEVVHHIGTKASTFSLEHPRSTEFANAVVRAHCGPGVEPYLSPINEAIEVSSDLARLVLRRLKLDGVQAPGSIEYLEQISDLSLAISVYLRGRWGVSSSPIL